MPSPWLPVVEELVQIPLNGLPLEGLLSLPAQARGIVLFAHGSGSSRHSPRNNAVARVLRDKGIGTLLLDLLTLAEELDYQTRFDMPLLTHRLLVATCWVRLQVRTRDFRIGYFGASTGAAAALQAAAALGREVQAVVSRGGRPDLAGQHDLKRVTAPTLLIVGNLDEEVITFNREAYVRLSGPKELRIIPGASHLFEEPGTLEQVAQEAAIWFSHYLKA